MAIAHPRSKEDVAQDITTSQKVLIQNLKFLLSCLTHVIEQARLVGIYER